MIVADIMACLEAFAPLSFQESYDNCGLQVGDKQMSLTGVLLTLDVTEEVLNEAIERNCNMIVAHHPLIFSGLKKIVGANSIQKIVTKAIKNDIAIYAIHTNLDNVLSGVNQMIAQKLGLKNFKILSPKSGFLCKIITYAPNASAEKVRQAMFAAGAGNISEYSNCSFNTEGKGSFQPSEKANPSIGKAGGQTEWVEETKIEVIALRHQVATIVNAMKIAHEYEEVAYDVIALENAHNSIGAGLVGNLPEPMNEQDFMKWVQTQMQVKCIRHTPFLQKPIQRVAVCGGSGSFLLKDAISSKADVFITGDFKYHQFFDAENQILIADIGHYESEQFTKELIKDILSRKFPNFAVLLSTINTNPVNYFC